MKRTAIFIMMLYFGSCGPSAGQVLYKPEPGANLTKRFAESRSASCSDWAADGKRHVEIDRNLKPNMLWVGNPKGWFGNGKAYLLQSPLDEYGNWRKKFVARIDVRQGRPTYDFGDERECIETMKGLPAVLIDGDPSVPESVRYRMEVESSRLELRHTLTVDANGKEELIDKPIAIVMLSETYGSSLNRNWPELLSVVVAFLALWGVLQAILRFLRRTRGIKLFRKSRGRDHGEKYIVTPATAPDQEKSAP